MGRAGCVRDRRTLLGGLPPFIQRPRRTTAERTRPAENQCARVCAAVGAPTEIGASGDASPRPRARARAPAPSSPSRRPRPSSRPSPPIPGTSAGRAAGAPCWRRGASASLQSTGLSVAAASLPPLGGVPAASRRHSCRERGSRGRRFYSLRVELQRAQREHQVVAVHGLALLALALVGRLGRDEADELRHALLDRLLRARRRRAGPEVRSCGRSRRSGRGCGPTAAAWRRRRCGGC